MVSTGSSPSNNRAASNDAAGEATDTQPPTPPALETQPPTAPIQQSAMATQPSAGMKVADRYQLVEPIASGGMAQVWKGTDLTLNRQVAVKVLHPHLAEDQDFVERFRREAIAAARLSHSSIVAIYDTVKKNDTTSGLEAIVMELIESKTLKALVRENGSLSAKAVIHIGTQICDGLDEAHRNGVVHRDIKPGNILICSDGRTFITDFGIAKGSDDLDLTTTGTLLGTAKYLAPEQMTEEDVDGRADLYSLGIVLFEALVGKPPYAADNEAATALARLHGDIPRCSDFRADVPSALDATIGRAMARRADDRFERAHNMKLALSSVDLNTVTNTQPNGITAARPAQQTPTQTALQAQQTQVQTNHTQTYQNPLHAQNAVQRPVVDQRINSRPAEPAKSRSWAKTFLLLFITSALVLCGVLLLNPLRTNDPKSNSLSDFFERSSLDTIPIDSAEPFDPQSSDGVENNDIAFQAFDAKPNTYWKTQSYNREGFAGLKSGLGIFLRFDDVYQFEEIVLQTNTEGWEASIYVGDKFVVDDFEGNTFPTPAATVTSGGLNETITFSETQEGPMVLLWLTETGVSDGEHRFELGEVSVR